MEEKAQVSLPSLEQSFVVGSVQTPMGQVPQVSSALTWADRLGSYKARWGWGRMNYAVDPGLYALGKPDEKSPVLVSANYKMSFDQLREALSGTDVWILVLNTNGINVWCAAGKGSFGTKEIVSRIGSSALPRVVSHRRLILPQLAGPGVSAHQVKKLSGFEVIYGPIRAEDIPPFIDSGMKATPEMRLKRFPIQERVVLIPVELVAVLKWIAIIIPILLIISGFLGPQGFWANLRNQGLFVTLAVLVGILAGAVFTPIFLPWLPGRAFSLKGFCLGLVAAFILLLFRLDYNITWALCLEVLGWSLLILAIAMYTAMNFTGASTYTSLSGVRKEMRWALPFQIGASVVGFGLWLGSFFVV